MGQIIQHKGLAERWGQFPLEFQLANIGSEVSRAIHSQDNPARFQGAFNRALELFDFSIDCAAKKHATAALRELCITREEFCDYFNGNSFGTAPNAMMAYYNQFALLARKQNNCIKT